MSSIPASSGRETLHRPGSDPIYRASNCIKAWGPASAGTSGGWPILRQLLRGLRNVERRSAAYGASPTRPPGPARGQNCAAPRKHDLSVRQFCPPSPSTTLCMVRPGSSVNNPAITRAPRALRHLDSIAGQEHRQSGCTSMIDCLSVDAQFAHFCRTGVQRMRSSTMPCRQALSLSLTVARSRIMRPLKGGFGVAAVML